MRSSIFYIGIRGVSGLLGVSFVVVLTRLLEPEEYGVYSVVFSVASLISVLLFQWLREGLLRYLPALESSKVRARFYATVFWSWLAASILAIVAGVVIFNILQPRGAVVYAVLLAPIMGFHGLNLEIARSNLQPMRYAALWVGRSFWAVTLPILVAAVTDLDGTITVLIVLLSFLFPSIINSPSWVKFQTHNEVTSQALRLLRFGGPFAIGLIGEQVLHAVSRTMLLAIAGAGSAGVFAAVMDLVWALVLMLALAANTGHVPRIMKAASDGNIWVASQHLNQALGIVIALLTPVLLTLVWHGDYITRRLMASSLGVTVAEVTLYVVIAAAIYAIKVTYFDVILKMYYRGQHQLFIFIAILVIYVTCATVLIPKNHEVGAAQALVAASLAGLLGSWASGRKLHKNYYAVKEILNWIIVVAVTSAAALGSSYYGFDPLVRLFLTVAVYVLIVSIVNRSRISRFMQRMREAK